LFKNNNKGVNTDVRKTFHIQSYAITIICKKLYFHSQIVFYLFGLGFQSNSSRTKSQQQFDQEKQKYNQEQEQELEQKLFVKKQRRS